MEEYTGTTKTIGDYSSTNPHTGGAKIRQSTPEQKKEECKERLEDYKCSSMLCNHEIAEDHYTITESQFESERRIAQEELLQDMYKKSAGAIIPDFIEEYAQSIGITLTNNDIDN